MAFAREEFDVVDGVGGGQFETAAAVVVSIDVIRVDGVAAFVHGEVHALFHQSAHSAGANVQPALALPSVERLAQVGGVEVARILAPVLPGAGGEVADGLVPGVVDRPHRGRGIIEEVEVEGGEVRVRCFEGVGEDDLP